jgi:SAM-dependent methyltransferase
MAPLQGNPTGLDSRKWAGFLEIASCPECRGPLELVGAGFSCQQGHSWPIKRGIPRFVGSEGYAGNFGFEWQRHRRTQLDRTLRTNESEIVFKEKTGLTPEDVRGKRVLDIGVGTGRFSDVIARWGGEPFGCDLSLAVETARRNLEIYPNAFVAQANLFSLPFRPQSFDIVFSIGVLHHTPDTFAATKAILSYVKPGGTLVIWVYEKNTFQKYSNIYRRWTTRMPQELLYFLSNVAVPYYHVLEAVRTIPWVGERWRDKLHWYLPTSLHKEPLWRVLDTFDWYSPKYQWCHTPEEVRHWFEELGLEDIWQPALWQTSVRGRTPREPTDRARR